MPIPAPIPTAVTGPSLPGNQAGGGQGYVNSGTCSGTAFTHTQDLIVFYQVTTINEPSNQFPPTCATVSALNLTVMGGGSDSLGQFSTSSAGSGCAGAANAVQAHTMVLSSTDAAAGMGTQGAIYTTSGGYRRRWTQTGDVASTDYRTYTNALYLLPGLPTGWNNNADLSNNVARQVIRLICNGGMQYSPNGVAPPQVASPWPMLDFGLIDI
jgi:hypothetical protein